MSTCLGLLQIPLPGRPRVRIVGARVATLPEKDHRTELEVHTAIRAGPNRRHGEGHR